MSSDIFRGTRCFGAGVRARTRDGGDEDEVVPGPSQFLSRTILGLRIDQKVLISLLGHYKRLEQDIIALTGMSEDTSYRDMLIDNLGLTNWRIFGGGSGPESA